MTSETPAVDFDVLFEADDGGASARVLDSPAGESDRTPITLPFNSTELENLLLKIEVLRGVRRVTSNSNAARTLGTGLYRALFDGEIGRLLASSLDRANLRDQRLRVRLRLADCEPLSNLPWELLYDEANGRYLSLSERTPVIRYLDLPDAVRPLTVTGPLNLLVVLSSPSDYPELDIANEKYTIHQALDPMVDSGRVRIEILETATFSELQDVLRAGDYHVLHFVGHGGFDPARGGGLLAFQDASGHSRLVSAEELGTILHDHRSLRLVVLNSCDGARAGALDPYSGCAQNLVRQGIPAVIAMQFAITDQAAIAFSRTFYSALATGTPIDSAAADARKAVYAAGHPVEWATPVVYLRTADGKVFDVSAGAAPAAPAAVAPPVASAAAATAAATAGPVAAKRTVKRNALIGAAGVVGALVVGAAFLVARDDDAPGQSGPATLTPTVSATVVTPAAPTTASAPTTPTTSLATFSVTVPSTVQFVDTGIDLRVNDQVRVVASGTIQHNAPDPRTAVGPDGDPNVVLQQFNKQADGRVIGGNHGALIGKVGESGPMFVVGRESTIVAATRGRLFLGVNDQGVDNNAGSFQVTVERRGG